MSGNLSAKQRQHGNGNVVQKMLCGARISLTVAKIMISPFAEKFRSTTEKPHLALLQTK